MIEKLNTCAGLNHRFSIGHIARRAVEQQDPEAWLVRVTRDERLPEYVRYLADALLRNREPAPRKTTT